MRIGILDDEQSARKVLLEHLSRFAQEERKKITVQSFSSSEDLLNRYNESFDILLLDIDMPEPNGFQVAKQIRARDSDVVIMFITNMAQYAISGYEVEAVDFILKPVTYANFVFKLKKAIRFAASVGREQVRLDTVEGIVSIPVDSISYVEVIHNYLYYYADDQTYKIRGSMQSAVDTLPQTGFFRISNCYYVNLKRITKICKNEVFCGESALSISRSRKADFLQAYIQFTRKD